MTKKVPVPKNIYDEIRAIASGESIITIVHLHVRLNGPCEVVAHGRNPIKCRIAAEESRSERRKLKSKSVRVVITKS